MDERSAGPIDHDMLAAVGEGDVAAFARIIELSHDDMARVAFVVSGVVEPARDAVQAAWPRAWKELGTMRNPERLRPWLMSIAAREARWLTDAGTRTREDVGQGGTGAPATQASSAAAYGAEDLELARALAALDSHDRMIVGLRYVAGLGSDEIGRELGMPAGAVLARFARILKHLLENLRRLDAPTDSVDAYEHALAERIRSFSSRAVVPIDAAAVAQAAVEAAPGPGLAERLGEVWEQLRSGNQLGWIVAAGIFVIVAAAAALLGGGSGSAPIETPIPTDATRLCEPNELEARVTAWEEAGPDRLATVEMHNVAAVACLVDSLPEPWLVEAPQMPILVGNDFEGSLVRIGPGDVLRTVVGVRNYCGPDPRPPVTVAFRRGTNVLVAEALSGTDLSGIPPCGGYAGSKNDIQMQPWAP
jgi:RNA polymerase sigma-70 factor (ECF subfamily)